MTLDSQELKTGTKKQLERVLDFACGSGSLRLNVRHHSAVRSVVEAFGNRTGYNPVPLSLAFPAISCGDSDWDVASHVSPLTVSEAPSLASPLRLFFLSRWACLGFIGRMQSCPPRGGGLPCYGAASAEALFTSPPSSRRGARSSRRRPETAGIGPGWTRGRGRRNRRRLRRASWCR